MEKVRSIMSAANLPKWLWGELVSTASLLINISPCSSLKTNTPHNLWMKASDPTGSHHKLDYKILKVIGCRAYTYIKKEHRDKLSPKAKDLVMVGYNTISKAYRLLDPGSKKIVISRNVFFNEQLFPFAGNQSQPVSPGFEFSANNSFFTNCRNPTNTQSVTKNNNGVTGNDTGEREDPLNSQSDYEDCQSNPEQDTITSEPRPLVITPAIPQNTNIPIAFSRPTRSCGRPQFCQPL
jgi:hypothetical protein